MDLKSVLDLIAAVDNTGWKVFEVKEEQFSLRLERDCADSGEAAALSPAVFAPERSEDSQERDYGNAEGANRGAGRIVSPLVGIFRELSGREISTGQLVKKGEAVCIVEAMKLMNEIQMPEDGIITWRAVDEGEAVEYGQLLFHYQPAPQG